jgi:hypothetical protein
MLSRAKNNSYRDKTIAIFRMSYRNIIEPIIRMTKRRMELAVIKTL